MNIFKASYLVAFTALLLSGCGTSPIITDLRPALASNKFELEQAIILDAGTAFNAPVGAKYGFFQGTYVAEKENSAGTFYRSPPFSVFSPSVHGKYVVRTGGIWVPKDKNEKPKMYGYLNFEWQEVNDFASVLSAQPRTSQKTYVQVNVGPATPVNAVGGAIGGAIVNAVIAGGTGDILMLPNVEDKEVANRINALAAAAQAAK